jgi:hypothetical protein
MQKSFIVAAVLFATLSCGGCSVYMAASGSKEPNLANVHRGASRSDIEVALGQPKSINPQQGGQTAAVYEYTVGDEPSKGRAVGHGVMDVLTFGLWEVVGTPIEALNRGDKVKVNVLYDKDGNALDIQSTKL